MRDLILPFLATADAKHGWIASNSTHTGGGKTTRVEQASNPWTHSTCHSWLPRDMPFTWHGWVFGEAV